LTISFQLLHYHYVAAGSTTQEQRRQKANRFLAGPRFLVYIANLQFPGEESVSFSQLTRELVNEWNAEFRPSTAQPGFSGRTRKSRERSQPKPDDQKAFLKDLKWRTEKIWPELWVPEPDQEPPESIVRRMRDYLRRFWIAKDERERDWHIHRAREYYQRRRVLRETRLERNRIHAEQDKKEWSDLTTVLEARINDILDEPPPQTLFEDALFELQLRAQIASKRSLYCPDCTQHKPYFLSERKGTKYCSPECAQAALLASKRKSWNANKKHWRTK
jgi:hypothetical protein